MELQGKLALLTGITGTVGSRLAHRLVTEGVKVRALVRRPDPMPEFEALGIELVRGDITDPNSLTAAMAGADVVIHAAAYIGGDVEVARQTNTRGTENMVAAALAAKPQLFVHISTISVYDLYAGATEFDETSPLCADPKNPYQETKTAAERAVWQGAGQGLPVLVLRPCNVLSVHPTSYWGPIAVQKVNEGFHRWHPEGIFPWIHVENLCDLTLLAMQTPAAVGQAYTAIDGHVPNAEYWGRIARWVGNTAAPDGTPARWHFRTEKNRSLGYEPRISFEQAMEELHRYARAKGFPG